MADERGCGGLGFGNNCDWIIIVIIIIVILCCCGGFNGFGGCIRD